MAEITGIISNIIAVFKPSFAIYRATSQLASHQQYELLTRNYGMFCASVVVWLSPETARRYELIHHYILRGSKEEALKFQQDIKDECNMTAVAGAIIAQVAITALSLPFLSNTYWTARACFLIAVTSGCLSVYYSCVLQRIVGNFYNAEQIKEWLMVPGPATGTEEGTHGVQDGSLAAIFTLSAPFALVKVSIIAFLVGLAIYQGLVFTKNLDNNTVSGDSRDSFIALMLGTGLCSVSFLTTLSAKDNESTIRSQFSRLNKSSPRITKDAVSEFPEAEGEALTEKPSGTTLQLSSITYQHGIVHEREPANEQQRVKPLLASLLEAAAQAHTQCAEADQRVAVALANSSTERHAG
ncbi:MAG: hypothetical protein M1812_001987 [Candelaria pacifica]|nr:MAG: hypothetical protein M1812_001987 [Candelaria pacifica]